MPYALGCKTLSCDRVETWSGVSPTMHHEMVSAGGRVAESRFRVDAPRHRVRARLVPELPSGGPAPAAVLTSTSQ